MEKYNKITESGDSKSYLSRLAIFLVLLSGCSRPPVGRYNTFDPEDMAVEAPKDFSWPMDSRFCPPPPNGTWHGVECSGCWCARNDAGDITPEMERMAKLCDQGDKEANIFCGNLPIQ